MGKTIKILSIDGGGTRGLMPSTILHKIEQETGKAVTDLFDVIVGSATGGIIAAALAAGVPTDQIIDIYLNKASYILPGNFFRRVWNPVNLFAPKYPNKNLKQLLEEKLGCASTLGDVYEKYGKKTIFLLASLHLSPELQQGETPAFKIKIYNSAFVNDHKENLVDVALRTSAAAVNLPIYQNFGEGGNYANDPALIGFSFCLNGNKGAEGTGFHGSGNLGLGADIQDMRMLSLGCGSDGGSFIEKKKIGKGNWGLIKWMGHLVNLVIDTNMVYSQYLMCEMLDEKRYLRVNPYYKAEQAPDVLKNKKLRIDVQEKEQLEAIKSYAESTFEKEKDRIMELLEI
jgi:patatin-like phospholipase/acyl hydrolase